MSNALRTTVTGRYIGGGLFEPRADANNEEKRRYSACMVLEPSEAAKVDKIVKAAITEKWGANPPAGLQNWGVREGDDPEYEFSFEKQFINPKAVRAPKVLRREDGLYLEVKADSGVVYAGCYGATSIEAYAYDGDRKKKIKPGVTLSLRAFMFTKDGEPLGDIVKADEDFDGVEVSEAEDDFLNAA